MSLFKTRDLWSATCDNDLFDLGCLKVANLGANKKYNSIVTGSYNGFLRIYNPPHNEDSKDVSISKNESFKAHDLVCETSFPNPILQIETGRFVSTSSKQHLAVLFPKKLAVFELVAFEKGKVDHGNQYSLKFIYEHVLERNAYNMCIGPFGGLNPSPNTEPHEYICVQSMDGMLSVFEYESFSLSCFLPKVLIPGPFKYVPKTDSFITVCSSWELESYRYQTLAISAKTYERNKDNNTVKFKKILPEYTFNLGEAALDIEVITQVSSSSGIVTCSILVLGERNLYCLSETCVLRFMKKFDYNPSCFCAYPVISSSNTNTNNSINYIIASHAKVLFIHEDVKVKWAAQVDNVPVQIVVAKINDLNGVIVSLSEDGKLRCNFLGTEPAFSNPIIKEDMSKPFNYQVAENQYRSLQSKIKNAIMNTGAIVTNVSKSGLIIEVDIPNRLDPITPQNKNKDTELKDPIDSIPSITCKLLLRSVETVQNVKITVNCSLPIVAIPETVFFSSIGSVQYDQEICFYMRTKHIPSNLNVTVCATYCYSTNGASKITETKFRLPLKLIMKSGLQSVSKIDQQDEQKSDMKPQLNNSNVKKITLETNRPCASLTEIFPEFSGSYIASNGNILAAQIYGHAHLNISIQGAKSGANRYRIQSENYESIWLLTQEFIIRLQSYYSKQSQEISITYQDPLPTEDFKLVIDKHLELRQTLERYKEILEQCCIQFRAIQKRLLAKFKDKSPSSLENMDALLEATYRQITMVSDNYLNAQKDLSLAANSLNCMSNLYVLLVSLAFKFGKDAIEVLESVMTNQVGDTGDLGWEEIVNIALSNLIRNALSKTSKDASSQPQPNQQLKLPQDSTKLEKQLKSLISKLENGATLVPSIYKKKESNDNKIQSTKKQISPTNSEINLKSKNELAANKVQTEPPPVPLPPSKKAPVAVKTKFTMGEDFDDDINSNEEQPNTKPFGSTNLPTFEELMDSNDKRKKLDFNWDDD